MNALCMKHGKLIVLFGLLICVLILCCSCTDSDNANVIVVMPTPEPKKSLEMASQEQVISMFEIAYEGYLKNGFKDAYNYARLEDIQQRYPKNEVMFNLYQFCKSIACFDTAQKMGDIGSDLEAVYLGEAYDSAASINPAYTGPYAEEIISYAKEVLGDDYEELANKARKENENYQNLSFQDKKDIVNYIYNHPDTDVDTLWATLARMYGITELQVTYVYTDVETLAVVGEERKQNSYDAVTDYDGILSYGGNEILIASSRSNLDKALKLIAKGDDLSEMFLNGHLAYAEDGCKVKVVETTTTSIKVKLLTGGYSGNLVWVIKEAFVDK